MKMPPCDHDECGVTACQKPNHMTATLALKFEDGSSTMITVDKVIEIDTPDNGRKELSFRQTKSGWVMAVSKPLLTGKLDHQFLTATKNNPK